VFSFLVAVVVPIGHPDGMACRRVMAAVMSAAGYLPAAVPGR
jgi:hypothetical protein